MVRSVLLVLDGSLQSQEASALADSLLPKATEVFILYIVPQLPQHFICWPAFPDLSHELAKGAAYVSALRDDLERLGRNVRTRVHFSPLSAAEMDGEILKFAETHPPNLICLLALAARGVISSVVRRAATPVLVARPLSTADETTGRKDRKEQIHQHLEAVRVQRALLANPAAALTF